MVRWLLRNYGEDRCYRLVDSYARAGTVRYVDLKVAALTAAKGFMEQSELVSERILNEYECKRGD